MYVLFTKLIKATVQKALSKYYYDIQKEVISNKWFSTNYLKLQYLNSVLFEDLLGHLH